MKTGDIIYYSWGYDQTNVDFYQVVKTTEKSVKIRRLNQKTIENCFMSGNTVPIKDSFKNDDVLTKRIKIYRGEPELIFDYGVGRLWDGKPVACSWYA